MSTFQYTDASGNSVADALSEVTDPTGRTTTYTYNSAGLLEFVTDFAGRVTAMQYDQNDRLISITEPDPDGAEKSRRSTSAKS